MSSPDPGFPPCPACGGQGATVIQTRFSLGMQQCPRCKGSGKDHDAEPATPQPVKWTGFITRHGILHLFEDEEDMRKYWGEVGQDWSRSAWIDGVVEHRKAPG